MPNSRIRTLAALRGRTVAINVPDNTLYLLVAAVLPEPFAGAAEEMDGIVPIADLDQGATNQFMTVGYAATKTWAAAHPKTLAAFYTALEEGQEIADTDRAAVEKAMEDLPAKPVPFGVSKQTASLMAVPYLPVGAEPVGSVDVARLQSEVDLMEQFLGFPSFNIKSMLMGG